LYCVELFSIYAASVLLRFSSVQFSSVQILGYSGRLWVLHDLLFVDNKR